MAYLAEPSRNIIPERMLVPAGAISLITLESKYQELRYVIRK